MRYIIDTHVFLWIIEDNQNLTDVVRELYLDNSNEIYLSVASIWEMAIKISLKKLIIESRLSTFIDNYATANNIALLSIQPQHVIPVDKLPLHHRDPFDRLLVCQCLHERMSILSKDTIFDRYGVDRVW